MPRAPPSTLSGLQIGLVVSAVCFVAATVALLAVLVLRRRDQWESLEDDAELAEVSWRSQMAEARRRPCFACLPPPTPPPPPHTLTDTLCQPT